MNKKSFLRAGRESIHGDGKVCCDVDLAGDETVTLNVTDVVRTPRKG